MKRARPVKNLYFRWGLELNMDSVQVANILEKHGIIELISGRSFYIETDKAKSLKNFDQSVKNLLLKERNNEKL